MSDFITQDDDDNSSILQLARLTRAVELGFKAAGVTICLVAGVETFGTVLSWVGL